MHWWEERMVTIEVMKIIGKIFRALSCFIPLFLIFLLQNVYVLVTVVRTCEENAVIIQYNETLFWIWSVLILVGCLGASRFKNQYLDDEKGNEDIYWLKAAENTTAEYYFTYFSLFVISFYGVDATNPKRIFDMIIFTILVVLMIWVYIANDMYYINPILNLCGYKSFSVEVEFEMNGEKKSCVYKVFSRDNLCVRDKDTIVWVRKNSEFDFAVCGLEKQKYNET